MRSAKVKVNNISDRSRTIWLLVVVLTIMVAVSAVFLGTCLFSYVHRSDCVISLAQGAIQEKTPQTGSSTSVLQSTRAETVSSSEAAKLGLTVADNAKVWSTATPIELFSHAYRNASGDITVQSGGEDKVIAPGTEGKYTFSLKNTGTASADYLIWVETEVGADLTGLSLQARMTGEDGWLLGDDADWQQLNDLDGISTEAHLDAGKSADYTIYWQWPFEMNPDEVDTELGNTSVDQNLSLNVTIHTLASSDGTDGDGSGAADGSQKPSSIFAAVKTGDISGTYVWSAIAVMAGAVAVLVFFVYRRKKKEEDETTRA